MTSKLLTIPLAATAFVLLTAAAAPRAEVVGAQFGSCQGAFTRSPAVPTAPARFSIVNRSGLAQVRVYWVDSNGALTLYSTIAPGARQDQETYYGHSWRVTDETGRCLGAFVVNAPDDLIYF